jgi:hypothetical protein
MNATCGRIRIEVNAFIIAVGTFGKNRFFAVCDEGIVVKHDAVCRHHGIGFFGVVIDRIENGNPLSGIYRIVETYALGGFVFERKVTILIDFGDAIPRRCGSGVGIPNIEVRLGVKPVDCE